MISMPFEEIPVACGWPWHGLVGRTPDGLSIALPNGMTREFPVRGFNPGDCSFLFDMGLPDIPSPELEAAGGAWWGRALLHGRIPGPYSVVNPIDVERVPMLEYGLTNAAFSSRGRLWGAPLVIQPTDPDTPAFRVFCRAVVLSNTLYVRVLHDGQVYGITRPLLLGEIGQGHGQPDAASHGFLQAPLGWHPLKLTDDYPGFYRALIRDFRQNRMLLGVVAVAQEGAPASVVPLSAGSTRAAADWPASIFPLLGLLEVEVLPSLFEEGTSPDDAIIMRVLEDRRSALGDPLYETEDAALPGNGRQFFARWTQGRGLLNAFYDSAGDVQTIRYGRVQESTLHRRRAEGEGGTFYTQQDIGRTTTLQLFGVDGGQVDAFTLSENLTEINRGSTVRVIRTVTATGDADDIQDSGEVTGTPSWASALDVYMPGFHMFTPCLAHLYRIGGVDIIQPQDIRVAWIVAYGNRMGCLGFTREPYTTTAGNPIQIQMRKIATPGGAVDNVLSTVESKPVGFPNVRSLFLLSGYLTGAYNPGTGQLARGVPNSISTWV